MKTMELWLPILPLVRLRDDLLWATFCLKQFETRSGLEHYASIDRSRYPSLRTPVSTRVHALPNHGWVLLRQDQRVRVSTVWLSVSPVSAIVPDMTWNVVQPRDQRTEPFLEIQGRFQSYRIKGTEAANETYALYIIIDASPSFHPTAGLRLVYQPSQG